MLIDVAGITYAVMDWRKHTRLSMMVIASLGISIVKTGLLNLFYMSTSGIGGSTFLFSILRGADVLIGVCAHGLLIYAVFFGFREGQESVKKMKGMF
jgi:hypothetical protein